jgi:methanogenic corrinoid protein MtbC1
MRDEVARGTRASDAAATVRAVLEVAGPEADLVRDILAACERSDAASVRAHLSRALAELGLAACLDRVLMPAMRQVGSWWRSGRCDIDQEHLATEAARGWLEALIMHAPDPTDPVPIVLACGPTDLHTIGLESMAILLRYRGRACRLIGARTSVPDLTTAVRANSSRAVVIVSHINSGRLRAIQSLHAANTLGVQVFYAGNAFHSPRSRRHLPGIYLGTRLEAACELIDSVLRQPVA